MYEPVKGGVRSDGIVPELLHRGGAGEMPQVEPFKNVGPLVGLACAEGNRVLHWFQRDWANEHTRHFT